MPRKKFTSIALPSGKTVEVGGLVRYYLNGWRVGHLEEVLGVASVKIRPIKLGAQARLVTVGLDDMKEVS